MTKLLAILKVLASSMFYGNLLIKFEKGRVVFMEKTEKIKPED